MVRHVEVEALAAPEQHQTASLVARCSAEELLRTARTARLPSSRCQSAESLALR